MAINNLHLEQFLTGFFKEFEVVLGKAVILYNTV